jgi:hypothetical protein
MPFLICFALKEAAAPFRKIVAGNSCGAAPESSPQGFCAAINQAPLGATDFSRCSRSLTVEIAFPRLAPWATFFSPLAATLVCFALKEVRCFEKSHGQVGHSASGHSDFLRQFGRENA